MLCGPEEEVPEGAEPRTSSIGEGKCEGKCGAEGGRTPRAEAQG